MSYVDFWKESKSKMSGYLLDMASLWEVYLERLLLKNSEKLGGWRVFAQEELDLYGGCFFARPNYPDLVLRKKDDPSKVVILDAKFKKMGSIKVDEKKRIKNADVDRNDLHQIHSYAGYYRENGDTVVLCGLIYPLSLEKPANNEENLYGLDKPKTLFVIDGIYKGKKSKQENSQKMDDNAGKPAEDENSEIPEELDKEYSYVKAEEAFIKRMQEYLK
jgi:5-methylcytosine-specific restriction endonuclease McrBC regulatory subunit McrC